jgi:pyruvate/2-oxoacid:ferredoxin oxidoreductase alpha subunit
MLLSGNHAVAWGAMLCRPQVCPVYPITPQTPILEKITEFVTDGEMQAEIITPESEHSAIAASIAASMTGARVFTATSSQGLLLMHELLHWAAGVRSNIVMFNVNRTIASPWGFWPDQTDSMAQRDTGWVQIYTESAQESLDTVIQAFKLAESINLPTMINHDAFYVSHAVEAVEVPSQELVDEFLPPLVRENRLDPEIGQSVGSNAMQETYRRARMDLGDAMDDVLHAKIEISHEWEKLSGRDQHGGLVERYRCEDAQVVIVTLGSMCGTVREAIDVLRDQGRAVGFLKVKLLRPFPINIIRESLFGVPDVLVLDRNFSPGLGGVLHQEIRSALYGMDKTPNVYGYLAGVGGVNVSPEKIIEYVDSIDDAVPSSESIWN